MGRFRDRQGQPQRKPSQRRRELTTILIVGEGQQTEPNYFRGLRDEDVVRKCWSVHVKAAHGFSPEEVIKETIKHKTRANRGEPYDEVWAVLDVEGPDKLDSLKKAMKLAKAHNIKLCLSNPSFEVWLLAHFCRSCQEFDDGDHVIIELNKHWRKLVKHDYGKSDDKVYTRLSGLTTTATANAKDVLKKDHKGKPVHEANSSTEAYLLVERLLNVPPQSTALLK